MLKKMRWRLVLAAMMAFFVVILLVAVLVNATNFYDVTRRADQTISYIANYERRIPDEADPQTNPPGGGLTPNPQAGSPGGSLNQNPQAVPIGDTETDLMADSLETNGIPRRESDAVDTETDLMADSLETNGIPRRESDAVDTKTDLMADSLAGTKAGSGTPPSAPFMALPDIESNYMTRFFVVRLEADGSIGSVSTDYVASIDEAEAISYAEEVLRRKKDRGYVKEYRYCQEAAEDKTFIIFLNVAREQQFMRSLRTVTAAVSAGSLLLVFLLVLLLSKKAIWPIANNIRVQKQFITDASHELKTPLTSISTSIDVITMEHGDDEWTENIKKQTARMSKLVSELVTLSRLDEDVPLPKKEAFSLSNAAWEIAEVYQPQAKAQGKRLSVDIPDDIGMVGEKAAIQQMLSVLLDNAIRYSDPKGELRFGVRKKKNRIQIEVFNTCQLETPPDVKRLFDRFYRPDSSRSTDTGGTGVGLAIAKAVAEAHGGTITAICPSGKTMTIQVTI